MSQESVELVRRMYVAFSRNEWAAAWSLAHPDVEVTFQRGPNAGTHRGLEQIQALFDDVRVRISVRLAGIARYDCHFQTC
jgi:hypothetical protein